jgi:hypothetical protein
VPRVRWFKPREEKAVGFSKHTVLPDMGAWCRRGDQHGLAVQHMAMGRHRHRRRQVSRAPSESKVF